MLSHLSGLRVVIVQRQTINDPSLSLSWFVNNFLVHSKQEKSGVNKPSKGF